VSWSGYGSFLVFAVVLVFIPGPDFVAKNTLAGGRRRGWWSAIGAASSNAVQGSAAAAGIQRQTRD
jgi:threonine/homoserine/homoserine lactone efflux protein